MAFSVLSVALRGALCLSARFVVFDPSSGNPSSSTTDFYLFYWSSTRIASEGFGEVSLLVLMGQQQ